MIAIVDYGVGNPGALMNMLEFIGYEAFITGEQETILRGSHLLLPGVGAFDTAMRNLRTSALIGSLEKAVFDRGIPLLGICLGMQLLGRRSEEGLAQGLGWLDADCVKMRPRSELRLKVPFMGWAEVEPTRNATLFSEEQKQRFYFSHSYKMQCDSEDDVAATYEFGEPVVCSVQRGNIFGVQFHPEKSHRFGMTLLRNFIQRTSNETAHHPSFAR